MAIILSERGYFWDAKIELSETLFAPDEAVYGLLEVDEEGSIRLELDGLLKGPGSIDFNSEKTNEQLDICGKLKSDASSVMLIGAYRNGQTYSTHNISHEKFVSLHCLASKCEVEMLKKQFKNLRSVKAYCGSYKSLFAVQNIKYKKTRRKITAAYKFDKARVIKGVTRTVIIDQDIKIPYGNERQLDHIELDCCPTIEVKFPSMISVQEASLEFTRIQDLLTILTGRRCDIGWPRVIDQKNDTFVTLYYLRGRQLHEGLERHHCWTHICQIDSNIQDIISSWFERREILGAGIFLYLATRRGMDMYAEHRFMSLMWGLEAFHRALSPQADDAAVRNKIDRIIEAVAPKDRRWLRKRLSGPVEPGLDTRIYKLFESLPIGISSIELSRFAQECRTIRNNISHFGSIQRSEGESDYDRLNKLSMAVSYLYHLRVLMEISVPKDHIRWIAIQSFSAGFIRRSLQAVGINLIDEEKKYRKDRSVTE